MAKPPKPYPEFPLFAHLTKRWAKKVQGKTRYYGPWDDPMGALDNYNREQSGCQVAKTPNIPKPGKSAKPSKPRADFPLFPHSGRWAKKIRGQLHYFGKWDDPRAALEKWLEQKDDLIAGREPRIAGDGLTLVSLVNQFLAAKKALKLTGELKERTWKDYYIICEKILDTLGKNRSVADLHPADFQKLRNAFSKTHGPVAVCNDIGHARVVFNFAYKHGLLEKPLRYGDSFKKPSRAVLRRERHKKGPKMFQPGEIRALLDIASPQVKAMILLGINCGFGNADCLHLQKTAIESEWLNYPRPKTGIERKARLWPETIKALEAIKQPAPKDKAHAQYVFITKRGFLWDSKGKTQHDDPIAKEFSKLIKLLDIHRPGLGFYGLRHTFETVAGETGDQVAVNYIMGHAPSQNDMGAVYREEVTKKRLFKVAKYVRRWLFRKTSPHDKQAISEPALLVDSLPAPA